MASYKSLREATATASSIRSEMKGWLVSKVEQPGVSSPSRHFHVGGHSSSSSSSGLPKAGVAAGRQVASAPAQPGACWVCVLCWPGWDSDLVTNCTCPAVAMVSECAARERGGLGRRVVMIP